MTKSQKINGLEKPDLKVIHDDVVADLWITWEEWRDAADGWAMDPVQFSRLSVVSMNTVAAVVAVDSLMTEDQFVDVCRTLYQEALIRAPKFK